MIQSTRIVECESPEEWNTFVRERGTLHHLFGWTFVNRDTFGCRCVNLAFYDGNRIRAIYPFIVRGYWPLQWYVSPNDFGGGPIGESPAVQQLIEDVEERARHDRVIMNEIRYGEEYTGFFSGSDYEVIERHNLVIDLKRSRDEIWSSFRDKVRNSIRRSEEQGITVTEGGVDQLDDYLELVTKHSLAVGYRPRSRIFIRSLFKHLDATLLLAHWQKKIVGGCVYLHFNERANCISATRDPELGHLRIGEALHWAGVCHFMERGFNEYDFMSRNDNRVVNGKAHVFPELSSLHRFKGGWKPREEITYDLTRIYSQLGKHARKFIAGLRNRAVGFRSTVQRRQT